ncbi:MAG TPA: nucleotidyltransferase domain-containing protein [Anaerolineaceae bacterium]|nr:nucleotidyltransferase domain-containing protein [Anaerolineaceae bacterium]
MWKELARLERMGILSSESVGNTKAYRVNPACPIAPELRSIVLKTAGVGDAIRRELAETHGVKAAFIYGSYASGQADERSDLDLLVIGEVDLPRFASLIAGLEKQLNRPINYVIASQQEWNEKLARKDSFATNVTRSPKIPLIGEDDAL